MGNLGQLASQSENIAHNRSLVAGEHLQQITDKVDHSVTETESMPTEGNVIGGDGNPQSFSGKNSNKKKKENAEKTEDIQIDPDLGNFIDIRE